MIDMHSGQDEVEEILEGMILKPTVGNITL